MGNLGGAVFPTKFDWTKDLMLEHAGSEEVHDEITSYNANFTAQHFLLISMRVAAF